MFTVGDVLNTLKCLPIVFNAYHYKPINFLFTYACRISSIFGRRVECAVERIERGREPAWAGSEEAEYIAGGSFVIPAFCHGKRVGLSKLMLKRFVCAHVIGIYGGVICAKQPKEQRCYYAGAVFTRSQWNSTAPLSALAARIIPRMHTAVFSEKTMLRYTSLILWLALCSPR